MWTPGALASEARPWRGQAWRVVEGQAQVSTMKLVDNLVEQDMLERIIDRSKPKFPPSCEGLDFLLFTPFRYWPYPEGSRFRRAHQPEGCFYSSAAPETAVAEAAFSRWLFYSESPEMVLPANALEHTAFCVQISTALALDLRATMPRAMRWRMPRGKRASSLSAICPCATRKGAPTSPCSVRKLLHRRRRTRARHGASSSDDRLFRLSARCRDFPWNSR
jgi:hypothetical protein